MICRSTSSASRAVRSLARLAFVSRAAIGLTCMSAFSLVACSSIGPPTIARDRFDYVSALSESWKRQALLNLLKVRYADAPVFMDVASVINSYSLESEVSLDGQVAKPTRGDVFARLGITGTYADKPTITYQPLSGDKFARSLMVPIPIPGILSLIQAGYPADLVLRMCVNSVNGLENVYGGPANPRQGSPKFVELAKIVRKGQASGTIGFQIKPNTNSQVVEMFIRLSTEDSAEVAADLQELLGLDPTRREFQIVPGPFAERGTEIAIQTRSILQIMIDLGSYIDVPDSDAAEGRVFRFQRTAEQERLFPQPIRVREGVSQPSDFYTAVEYRNRWFWIEDQDFQSKLAFNFLLLSLALTESAPSSSAPLVTIPAR